MESKKTIFGLERTIYYVLILSSLFLFENNTFSQEREKTNISAGFGFPEFSNIGVRFQNKQTQIGIGLGHSFLMETPRNIFLSGNVYYHFSGQSELSERLPGYLKTGLIYGSTSENKFLWLNARIGRDFNLTDQFGLNVDIGLIFELYNEDPGLYSDGSFDFETTILPSIGISAFYRIK